MADETSTHAIRIDRLEQAKTHMDTTISKLEEGQKNYLGLAVKLTEISIVLSNYMQGNADTKSVVSQLEKRVSDVEKVMPSVVESKTNFNSIIMLVITAVVGAVTSLVLIKG